MTDEETMEEPNAGIEDRSPKLDRRGLVRGIALGSVAVGAGAVGAFATRATASSTMRRTRLVVEVACLGELFRTSTPANPANDADFRTAFIVEGWIYPEGTIKGDGFIPVEDGSIGRWFCRGATLGDATRAEPHTSSNTLYAFDRIRPENLFPRNTLITQGLEGTDDRTQTAWRAVAGGTGEYAGAAGEMGERVIATNTSPFGNRAGEPSPCWRCEFDIRVFD